MIAETIAQLGLTGRDKVTGVTGVITSVAFDIAGCVQLLLDPGVSKKGSVRGERIFCDAKRVEIVTDKPQVMDAPDFEHLAAHDRIPGPTDKPTRDRPIPARR